MAGLAPANIRLPQTGEGAIAPGLSIQHDNDEPGDQPQVDDKGAVIRIEHGDGTVTVSLDGSSLLPPEEDQNPVGWFGNLVSKVTEAELSRVCEDLLRGIDEDLSSRNEWIEERAQGIRLLGLKIEIPNTDGAADGAPVEGMSRVRHPLLQEAVLRFQANTNGEMLPADGPAKIRDDGNNGDLAQDRLADALQKDFNHYLTVTASEYYPDTDKMFFMLGFGGTSFKKVFFCPLRNRPVSESVDANDLIVSNQATSLGTARRVTHRVMMKPSTVKRMQIIGAYRDVDLDTPKDPDLDAAKQAANSQQGISTNNATRPEDRDREIYECYCELDLKGFEHKHRGKETGLEIPYRVTIDVSSRQILSIVRNYDESTKELPEARTTFVKYSFVPGLGFYDIGLLHILGNATNAVTAVWRELLDAGMFANFPGFLMSDTGARQNTNIFRIPPGGGQLVKTGGMPINQAVMPLPYKGPDPALMQLGDSIVQTGRQVGGTAEMPTGEGRADMPVGTVLAMIEQATKVLNSVHKRIHAAQAEEFRLLIQCFRENPGSFWKHNKKPANAWDEQTFQQAVNNNDLTPRADPNTSSFAQRVMKIMALKQLQASNPTLYDPIAIDMAAIQALGFSNPQQFMAPPQAQAAPPPEMQKMQSDAQAKQIDSQAKLIVAQAKAKEAEAKIGLAGAEAGDAGSQQVDTPVDQHRAESERMKAEAHVTVSQAKAQAELMNAHSRQQELQIKKGQTFIEDAQHGEELKAKTRDNVINLAKDVLKTKAEDARTREQMQSEHALKQQDMAHQHQMAERQHSDEMAMRGQEMQHEQGMAEREHAAGREDAMAERTMRAEEHQAGREDAAEDRKLKAKQASAKSKGKK